MQESNFCFKRSNFDQFLNKAWCPQCCECPKWCSTVYPKVTNQRMQSVDGYNNRILHGNNPMRSPKLKSIETFSLLGDYGFIPGVTSWEDYEKMQLRQCQDNAVYPYRFHPGIGEGVGAFQRWKQNGRPTDYHIGGENHIQDDIDRCRAQRAAIQAQYFAYG